MKDKKIISPKTKLSGPNKNIKIEIIEFGTIKG